MSAGVLLLCVAVAGGVGAIVRFVLDGLIRSRQSGDQPVGTMIINVTGSALLGLIAGLVLGGLPADLQVIAGAGFCGGYTTFSTACLETVRLLQQRRWWTACWYGAGTLVTACLVSWLGLIVGVALR